MALSLVTAPTIEPVTVAEAKLHLRVDASVTDEDSLIAALIVSGREYAETFTHRALINSTWDAKYDTFPCDEDAITIPIAPVSSVTSVTYTATDGTSTTWSSSLYTTDLPTGPKASRGRIVPAYGEYYPSTRDVINSVTVRFVAGYGTTRESIPESIRAAIKLLVTHWYDEGRKAVQVAHVVTPVPLTIESLLWPYKAF